MRWRSSIPGLGAMSCLIGFLYGAGAASAGWQAGTARVAITPKEPMWMAGYAARKHPSEGAEHELWAKALALQDPTGKKAVLVTLDLCGIDRELSLAIRERIGVKHGLERDQVVLSCSHTHCGPVVGTNLITMYPLDEVQRAKVADYTRLLEELVPGMVETAFAGLRDVNLAWES